MSASDSMELEEQAAALLLRSPNLSVSDVMELLDLGDAQFKKIAERNPAVARLLEARRQGELGELCQRRDQALELRICLTCAEEYMPYAGSRYCSDTCARLALIRSRTGPKAPPSKR
ncbi:MAG: hypothetical protein AB8B93_02175 [Pseudomonadales bacterium]